MESNGHAFSFNLLSKQDFISKQKAQSTSLKTFELQSLVVLDNCYQNMRMLEVTITDSSLKILLSPVPLLSFLVSYIHLGYWKVSCKSFPTYCSSLLVGTFAEF